MLSRSAFTGSAIILNDSRFQPRRGSLQKPRSSHCGKPNQFFINLFNGLTARTKVNEASLLPSGHNTQESPKPHRLVMYYMANILFKCRYLFRGNANWKGLPIMKSNSKMLLASV